MRLFGGQVTLIIYIAGTPLTFCGCLMTALSSVNEVLPMYTFTNCTYPQCFCHAIGYILLNAKLVDL